MSLHPITDKIIFPIYFDGALKNDYKDAMYVLNNGNCVTWWIYNLSVNMKESNLLYYVELYSL
jgi:hypothetical protein